MIREVSMPALSSTMETGKIVSWLKQPGDTITKGDNILVVESDKADMDVESFHSGILAAIVVPEGGTAPVGAAIALIAETAAEVEQARQQATQLTSASDRTSLPTPVPATVAPSAPTPAPQRNGQSGGVAPPTPVSTPIQTGTSERVIASPLAKKRAQELGIDLASIRGSGPQGRIVVADVEQAAQAAPIPRQAAPTATPVRVAAPLGETVPLTTLQAAVVKNMNVSLSVPTYRVGYTLTTTALDALYQQVKPKGVTMTALLAKAVATVLTQHPLVNANFQDTGIHYNAQINIAVAVAMEDGGLITPVLQEADRVDLYELSRRWRELVERARLKQLQPQEYNSGTLTISNLGMFGVDRFDAILPPQQGAILAIGASQPRVVPTAEGAITVKNQMQVNLTCDHRVIYGAHAAAFLRDLAQLLESNVQSLTL
ncbi:MAG: 2-oxo acid dehydrogenase subunit E2 [Synechococcaceae cyanobacterium SM2_3_1]|nr:2-oxo acid dehydrogenase subunit E2 [Synechococcaceae cyanobacterium SM2_3_1]